MKTKHLSLAALACVALLAGNAQAQSAGTFTARLGAGTIMPEVKSGDLSAPSFVGTRIDVKDASQVIGGITYMWTDNIAIDLPLGIPFKHEVIGAGAIDGVGKLGTTKALPVTLVAQYRFGGAKDQVRPYVGVGGVYAKFFDSTGSSTLNGLTGGTTSNPTVLTMKNKAGALIQLGAVVKVSDKWSVDMAVDKIFLKSTGHLSTGQNIAVKLNPLAVMVGVGYTF